MKAIILAAGVGSRLAEFTNGNPKCLLKIGEETILGREIRFLKELGFSKDDIRVIAGYKYEKLQDCGAQVIVNDKYDVLDNAYSLALGLHGVDDDVIVMDSDLVFDRAVLEEILSDSHGNLVLSIRSDDLEESTGIVTCLDGKASAIGKQYHNTGYVYISIFKVCRGAVRPFEEMLLLPRVHKTWYTDALTELMKQFDFYNKTTDHRWHEIDFVEDYLETQTLFGISEGK